MQNQDLARNSNACEVLPEQLIRHASSSATRRLISSGLLHELQASKESATVSGDLFELNPIEYVQTDTSEPPNPPGAVWRHPLTNGDVVPLMSVGEHTRRAAASPASGGSRRIRLALREWG